MEILASSKSLNHVYLLVKFGTNLQPQFRIVSSCDVVSYNYSSLDEEIFVQFPETIRLCSVIATSNDQFDLEYQILRLEAKCDLISDDIVTITIEDDDDDDVVDQEDARPEVNLPVTLIIEEVFVDEQGHVNEEWGINYRDLEPEGNLPVTATIENDTVEEEKSIHEEDVTPKVNHVVTTSILKDPVDEEMSDHQEDVTATIENDPVDDEMSVDVSSKVHLPVTTSNVKNPVAGKKSVDKVRKRPQRAAAKCKKYIASSDDEQDEKDYDDGVINLGPYGTSIPAKDFDAIDWNSYAFATRQLLLILFTKDILRTHSLTGKHCNANVHLKTKRTPQLDSKKIKDIISIVAKKCNVQQDAIRRVIKNKCAEELKLYKYQNGISVRKRYNKKG